MNYGYFSQKNVLLFISLIHGKEVGIYKAQIVQKNIDLDNMSRDQIKMKNKNVT